MKKHNFLGLILAGIAAGAVNGLFGAGGGMILIPLLSLLTNLEDREIFSASVAVILPVCITSAIVSAISGGDFPWASSIPYLIGSAAGGFAAGLWGSKIPAKWLHRGLGILILWGGIRYLC